MFKPSMFLSGVLGILAYTASAADLTSKKKSTSPAEVSPMASWLGFYAGVTACVAELDHRVNRYDSRDLYAQSARYKGSDEIFVGTVGWNTQTSKFVYDFEADASYSSVGERFIGADEPVVTKACHRSVQSWERSHLWNWWHGTYADNSKAMVSEQDFTTTKLGCSDGVEFALTKSVLQ